MHNAKMAILGRKNERKMTVGRGLAATVREKQRHKIGVSYGSRGGQHTIRPIWV